MLGQFVRSTIAIALAALLLCGCSSMSMSKTRRQQIAYAKYVRKFSHKRVKQQTKFKKWKMPLTPPSQPTVTSGVSDGPQSASSSGGN